MADYQKMYYILCDAASKALDFVLDTPEAAEQILRQALAHAEDVYATAGEEETSEK